MNHALVRVSDGVDWQVYHAIRRSSLWEERGLTGYDDARPEERLPNHHSLLLKLDGEGIGTTRLDDLGDQTGIVRLVAVTARQRGRGHGRVLSAMVEDYARKLGLHTLFVSAVLDAEGFYSATGWARVASGAPPLLGHADSFAQLRKRIVP